MRYFKPNLILVLIVIISAFMHAPHLPKDLISIHSWRQTQTQSTINNFYEEDMNIFNPTRNERGDSEGSFRMEFPLMQWLVASSYKVFGQSILVTRIFMFVIGIFSVLGMFKLLSHVFNNTTIAIMGAWAFNFSPSFYYYTINPLPDNLALCFGIWGLALFFKWFKSNSSNYTLLFSGVLLALSTLCKLPFIVLYAAPANYFLQRIIKEGINRQLLIQISFILVPFLLPLLWYITVIPTWKGNIIVKGMADNNDSYSLLFEFLWHNLISTLPELLLNYGSVLFFILGFYYLFKKSKYKSPKFILVLALSIISSTYYFYEINAIAKIHDYYLFPFYPLLFMLVGFGAYHLYNSKHIFFKYFTIVLLILLPLTCFLRMQIRWNESEPGFNKDLLNYKTELRNIVPNDALVVVGNDESHFIFLYYIDKKGWGFHNDEINMEQLNDMRTKGAEYLFTDSEVLISSENLPTQTESLIKKFGSIYVYRLKK